MNWLLLLIPVISAFIGWITNWVAIKMLFYPHKPTKILGITFQGIFPKRQQQFAEKLGTLVSEQLISFEEIELRITKPENLEKIIPAMESHIDYFLREKLGDQMPMIKMFISDKLVEQMKEVFMKELRELFPVIMKNYIGNLKDEFDLQKIVADKVAAFSTEKLEALLYQIMSKEFTFIEVIGAVLGFLIGLLQVLISLATT